MAGRAGELLAQLSPTGPDAYKFDDCAGTLADHARYPFSTISDRHDFTWPEGKRLAVYIGMNLECFAFGGGLGAELAPGGPEPDVLNYAWHDYGNRVGVWRMLDLFDRLSLPCTVLANSLIYQEAPSVVEAFRARGDEIAGHGRTDAERHRTSFGKITPRRNRLDPLPRTPQNRGHVRPHQIRRRAFARLEMLVGR